MEWFGHVYCDVESSVLELQPMPFDDSGVI